MVASTNSSVCRDGKSGIEVRLGQEKIDNLERQLKTLGNIAIDDNLFHPFKLEQSDSQSSFEEGNPPLLVSTSQSMYSRLLNLEILKLSRKGK